MNKETQKKLDSIIKYFKKDKNILELSLINYEGYNIYIRLDELKNTKTYKLSWFDLDLVLTKDIEKYISSEYIPSDRIEAFINNIGNLQDINTSYKPETLVEDRKVLLSVKLNTSNGEQINVEFDKYLPEEITYVYDILNFIFQNLPKKLEGFLYEIISSEFSRFYKICQKNNTKDLLEKVLSFDYYLCLGVEDDLLVIVNNQGSLELVPVVDEDNNPLWDVLEDTEDEYLTKEIENIIKRKKD